MKKLLITAVILAVIVALCSCSQPLRHHAGQMVTITCQDQVESLRTQVHGLEVLANDLSASGSLQTNKMQNRLNELRKRIKEKQAECRQKETNGK